MIHVGIALSEVLDVIIAIIVNLLTQEGFSFLSTHNLVMGGILVFCIAAHIACSIILPKIAISGSKKHLWNMVGMMLLRRKQRNVLSTEIIVH